MQRRGITTSQMTSASGSTANVVSVAMVKVSVRLLTELDGLLDGRLEDKDTPVTHVRHQDASLDVRWQIGRHFILSTPVVG